MSDKKPFVLRIDPEKLKALEKWAADEFRSTNGQIEYILDQALKKSGRWKSKTDNNNTDKNEQTS
ncbi:MAG: Arc family DNA-binding protein [Bacteroidetes bacterium]|nr:Arc family DNA-binding protein [Bacteroidota bacterium]